MRLRALPFRRVIVAACVAVSASGCGGRLWSYDLQSGLRRAQKDRKLILVEFSRLNCPYTAQMDVDVFPDPDVQREMEDFIAVRLDVNTHRAEATRRNVTITPTFLVARSNGTILRRHDGALSADAFRRFLIRANISQ